MFFKTAGPRFHWARRHMGKVGAFLIEVKKFLDAPVYDSPASLKSVSHPRVENVVVQVVISEAAELFLPTAVGEIVEVLWAPHLAAVF